MSGCYFCEREAEHEHHIVPDRFGGPDRDSNLVAVCSDCHRKLENLYDDSFYRWFGIEDSPDSRWRYKSCSFPGCDNDSDRLVVIAGKAIENYGSAEAVPRDRMQPACDECMFESVELMHKHTGRPTDEESVRDGVECRTVEAMTTQNE